jgi:aconitate hydratase
MSGMGENLTNRLLADHLVAEDEEEIALSVDQTLLQDATGTMACLQLEALGTERVSPSLAVVYVDHNILQIDYKNPDDHRFLATFAARHGIYFSRPGNGICHYLHLERFARPGQLLIGADSHTTTSGALGMVAIGAGGMDVAVAMAGHPFRIERPKVVGVRLDNSLPEWSEAKDVILELLRRRGVRGGIGKIFEFFGDGVKTLPAAARGTICNMIAELGATSAVFPSDERTREWLEDQARGSHWVPLAADADAEYDELEIVDLAKIEPLIAKPHSPGNVVKVRDVAGTPVAQVCVGSSVNSGYEDLAIVGAVLAGGTVHPRLQSLTVTPGSRQILDVITQSGVYRQLVDAGARMLEPACGPCVGMGQAPPSGAVSVRTFNRNFRGRSGTLDDHVYLCSPSTAAATALRGVITDPRDLGDRPKLAPAPNNPRVDDKQILAPPPPQIATTIEVVKGPNIRPVPPAQPVPEDLEGRVLIVVGDDLSTGDLAPDGALVMALRSNIPAISEYTLRNADAEFASRARRWGGGFIVAGANYGQGSSREHAAMAPAYLGVRGVIARSFARIHRRNLIAQGILPLEMVDPADVGRAERGQTITLRGVAGALRHRQPTIDAELTDGSKRILKLALPTSQREVDVLLAGGLLAFLKLGGRGLGAGTVISGEAER